MSVSLSAQTVRGSRLLSIDTTLRDFGTGSLCRHADTIIVLRNIGCDTLHLGSVKFDNGTEFTQVVHGTTSLAPGARDTIVIGYQPLAVGASQDRLTIRSDADNDSNATIQFRAQTYAPLHVTFLPVIARATANIDDTITVFIVPNLSLNVTGLTELSYLLNYDGDVLTPIVSQSNWKGMALSTTDLSAGSSGKLQVTFSGSGAAVSLDPSSWILSIRFHTTLTTTLGTPMAVSGIRLNHGDASFANCVLSAAADSSSLTLITKCGDSLVSKSMSAPLSLTMLGLYPDPAQTVIVAKVESRVSEQATLEIYDLVGVRVFQSTQIVNQGKNALSVSIWSLAEGSYILRLQTAHRLLERGFVKRKE